MAETPLDQVRSQHFELQRIAHSLTEVLGATPGDAARELQLSRAQALLEQLRVALDEHFALEEEGGYFSEIVAVAPRLSRQVEHLHQNHSEFRDECAAIVAIARQVHDPVTAWNRVSARASTFLAALREHEQAEDSLVLEAFSRDVGQSD